MDEKHTFYNVIPEQMLFIRVFNTNWTLRGRACMASGNGSTIGSLLLPLADIKEEGTVKKEWILEGSRQGAITMKLSWSNTKYY